MDNSYNSELINILFKLITKQLNYMICNIITLLTNYNNYNLINAALIFITIFPF